MTADAPEMGLIISGGPVLDRPAASNDIAIPPFHGEQALAGWKRVIDAVHTAGGAMAPQIGPMGIVAPARVGMDAARSHEGS